MSDKDILVVGYPRSGNGYTARLLGDILNSPVTGWESAHPICEEGLDRSGEYTIRQLHLRPDWRITEGNAIHNAWTYAPLCHRGEKIVYVLRDPRDVAVSVKHYWDRPSINDALVCMGEGSGPLSGVGSWQNFIWLWLNTYINPLFFFSDFSLLRYELLINQTFETLTKLLLSMNIQVGSDRIKTAIQRQAFATRKKELASSGNKYMYGAEVQVKSLRKGIVGNWLSCFTPTDADLADTYFGRWMEYYGYTEPHA